MAESQTFLPALRFRRLTPLFDPLLRFTMRERAFKDRLLDQAAIAPGESVLDLGSGTGTLALLLFERSPRAAVTGLDADPEVLGRARRKAAAAGAQIDFVQGFSNDLPFADARFDKVLSTLFFHHLMPAVKRATLAEVARVLKPGGELHVADWGKPGDAVMAGLFTLVRAFDGFEVTADNASGALPSLFAEAGLVAARVETTFRTPGGTLALYSARLPA